MTPAEIAMLVSAIIPLIGAVAAYLKARAAQTAATEAHLALIRHVKAHILGSIPPDQDKTS